jgi:glycosyltransferase involved in cell wall biosynthesis
MNIGVDVRYLSHGIVGGVRNYVRYLTPEIIRLATGDRIFLYADTKDRFELDTAAFGPNVSVRFLTYQNALSSIFHDLTMRRVMARDGVQVAHFPANYGFGPDSARTVFTLHDALTIMPLLPVLRGRGSRASLRSFFMTIYLYACSRATLDVAKVMFTVSDYARRDILKYCKFDPARILSARYGAPPHMRRITNEAILSDARARLGITRKFVLGDALKNPAVIARAWQRLPQALRDTHQIVFFSRRPDPLPVVGDMVREGVAQMLLRPGDEDLVALYNMAEAFLFPSWIEGFGIPLLEAMTCGAPVIASDRGSIPEIAGDAALIIDAEDDAALARHLEAVLTQTALARDLRARGFARAAEFTWEGAARQVLAGYKLALAS